MDSNALICDCQMLWLAKMLQEKQGTTQAAAICQSPDQLNGRSVTSLIEEFNCSKKLYWQPNRKSSSTKKTPCVFFYFPPEKPILTEEPTDVEITFGGTVYFTCKAEGDPEPDIVWLYNKLAITIIHLDGRVGIFLIYFLQFSNEISPDDDPKYQVLQDGTLMIENASDSDMGSYECMAKSPAG